MTRHEDNIRFRPCKMSPNLEFRNYVSLKMLKSVAAQAFSRFQNRKFRRGEQSLGETDDRRKEDR